MPVDVYISAAVKYPTWGRVARFLSVHGKISLCVVLPQTVASKLGVLDNIKYLCVLRHYDFPLMDRGRGSNPLQHDNAPVVLKV